MGNNNDHKIMEFKKQIEDKKLKLGKSQKFVPVTNCSFEIDGGIRFNIHAMNNEQIIPILIKLNSYAISARELELLESYKLCGFSLSDWITDLKAKLDYLSRKEEAAKLKEMENTLDQLLSSEKKVELTLDSIGELLK